jgi:uncharacterized protein YlaI
MEDLKCNHYGVDTWEYQEVNNRNETIYTGFCDDCQHEVEKAVKTITTEEVYLI